MKLHDSDYDFPVGKHPDQIGFDAATQRLHEHLMALKLGATRHEVERMAVDVVHTWLKNRAFKWSETRGRSSFRAKADATDIGFAMGALPRIFDACADLPYDKPIFEWSREEVATLFANAAVIADDVRTLVLECPDIPI